MRTDTPQPIRLRDYEPPAYLIDRIELDISLAPKASRVRSRLTIRPNPLAVKPSGPLVLDGAYFTLESLSLDRRTLDPRDYVRTDANLTIPKPPARAFTLEAVTVVDPEANTALSGLYRSRGVYTTQCEAEGFRRITYFIDRPDVLSVYTCRIEADRREVPVLLANGNLRDTGTLAGGNRHFAVWDDPHPKPCYLFALVGGDLAAVTSSFKTMSGRKVDLNIYVEHGKEERAQWAMDALKRSMAWDERRFGREYDLEQFNIVAVSDFNMGAMENKGLNIFNDRLILASPETATDSMFEAIESVVAHEYFHNWTGNRITCRDWFQLCLKEGLTVFRDQEFSADERERTVQRISDVRQLRATQFPEDAGPLAHPVRPESYIEINNFYTPTIYEKGAEVVRMIATILGRRDFRAGMDLFFDRHDGEAVTIEDFLACFSEVSGRDLSQFKLWYSQAGTPQLVAAMAYDKASRTAELKFEQVLLPTPGEPRKKPLHIPVRLGLIGANGQEIDLLDAAGEPVPDAVVHVTKRSQTFRLTNVASRPVLSLLRGFSAPVNVALDLSDRELEFLMVHDSDGFNRWQAANTYAGRIMRQGVETLAAGKRFGRGGTYAKALAAAVAEDGLEPAYKAELLRLPTQADIAREIGRDVDPDHVFRAHRQFTKTVATALGGPLEEIYDGIPVKRTFSPDARSAGRRALRNAALALLTARGEPGDMDRLMTHFREARNMTDEAAALFLIAGSDHPEREAALARFFKRWQHDHVVVDTWFAAQAQGQRAGSVEAVRTLTAHPLYSRTAPNKVRAVVGTFAAQNLTGFHRADGAGYDFVVSEVLKIDRVNPQIAARMLQTFKSWRALAPHLRAHARRALQKVAKTKELSRDVFEIVNRMLDN